MKKIIILFAAMLSVSAMIIGCSDKKKSSGSKETASESSTVVDEQAQGTSEAPVTEPATDEPIRDIEPAEGTYIYDYAKILSSSDYEECNNYAEWLYENFLINAAVVTTDSLGGLTPEEYAENAYVEIYSGKGSGLLLLINNDTNEDYLYKKGSCLTYIPEDTQSNEFYWATQEIVAGDYKSAIMRLMKLGEYCSQYVFDNAGVFSAEEIAMLEQSCTESPIEISVLATTNLTDTSNFEICSEYYRRRYSDDSGILILLDINSKTVEIQCPSVSSEENETFQTAAQDADTLAAAGDYVGALTLVIDVMKGIDYA